MITDKVDGIIHLLIGQNIVIIKELIGSSCLSNELLLCAMRKCYLQQFGYIDSSFVSELISLFDTNILEQENELLNYWISNMRSWDMKITSECFMRLTDLGAIVKANYNFCRKIDADTFFHYVSRPGICAFRHKSGAPLFGVTKKQGRNQLEIGDETLRYAVCRFLDTDQEITDYIFDQYESSVIQFDLHSMCQIVLACANIYFDRMMQKIANHPDIEIIITYTILNSGRASDDSKILAYATECANYDKLQMLEIIKAYIWDPKDVLEYEKTKIQTLICGDSSIARSYNIIASYFNAMTPNCYDNLMYHLSLFVTYYA